MPYPVFRGNCPNNVSRDAKYSVRWQKGTPVIQLYYEAEEEEIWLASTSEHPKLVEMVNGVKTEFALAPNGAFYINEYKQVIVPVANGTEYYFAGNYKEPLRFEFEGKTLSGEPVDLEGNPISVGDKWVGPHPGVPYILCAGGQDIRYEISPRPNVMKKVRLSKQVGPTEAAQVAAKIRDVKGYAGGRFYLNEFGVAFAPLREEWDTVYVYLGKINLKAWFPKTDASEE